MRIDSAGNVGIGVSPSTKLHIYGTASSARVRTESSSGVVCEMLADGAASGTLSVNSNHPLTFQTNSAERMRIDAGGNLLIGTASLPPSTALTCTVLAGAGNGTIAQYHANSTANGTQYQGFYYNGGLIGSVTQATTSTVAFNTSSDVRLKKNIVDAPSAVEKVKAIKVRSFDWKSDDSHVDHGFIAQELNEVDPLAVTEGETWGVDPSKLVATLTKALQEALVRIEALEAQVAAM
jgi:hypothetical protein